MQTSKIQNAIITSASLGWLDRVSAEASLKAERGNPLTFSVDVAYGDGSVQSFCGYMLDQQNEETGEREGTAFGTEIIARILMVAGANTWEQLVGKPVRVMLSQENTICALGHLLQDTWVNPTQLFDEMNGYTTT